MAAVARMGKSKKLVNEANVRDEIKKLVEASRPVDQPCRPVVDIMPLPGRPNVEVTPGSWAFPTMVRSSSEQAMSYTRPAPAYSPVPASRGLTTSASTSSLGGAKAVSMHALLAAAQRNVDPRDLPDRKDWKENLSRRLPKQLEPMPAAAQAAVAQVASPEGTRDVAMPIPTPPAAASKSHLKKTRTWSTKEESAKLNIELEKLGEKKQNMKWASPEIENLWLRKEVTSKLLETLLKNSTPADALSEVSTRAHSRSTSGYATPTW